MNISFGYLPFLFPQMLAASSFILGENCLRVLWIDFFYEETNRNLRCP